MDARPFLELDGAEVINSLRSFTYLRRGLGSSAIDVGLVSPRTPEVGYRDDYVDTYEADLYWPGNLRCYCPGIDTGPYASPAADPAPWYDPARPESGDFLGFEAAISLTEVPTRGVTQRSTGGASVGQQRLAPRLVQVVGTMYAGSEAGMGWGERWLAQALAGPAEGCTELVARIMPTCSPAGEEALPYFRELLGVGLVDGPVYAPIDHVGACWVQDVSFQLLAGRPHLRQVPVDAMPWTILRYDPTPSATIAGPGLIGDTTARITVVAGHVGGALDGVVITATEDASCPSLLAADIVYPLGPIPRGTQLEIDSSTRLVTLTDSLTGETLGGPDLVDVAGLFPWLEAGPGETWCVAVDATSATVNAGSLVRVEAIGREL